MNTMNEHMNNEHIAHVGNMEGRGTHRKSMFNFKGIMRRWVIISTRQMTDQMQSRDHVNILLFVCFCFLKEEALSRILLDYMLYVLLYLSTKVN